MTVPFTEPGRPLALCGTAHERGKAQATEGEAARDDVRRVTRSRVSDAQAGGLIGDEARRYLDAQRGFAESECDAEMAELAGIAEAFDITFDELFIHLHLGTLRDLTAASLGFADGCSAWAVADGPDGPIAVKNRDFSGHHAGIQRVFRHEGPDLSHGPMLCLGSLGSPGAYSSGINAAGLAVVDTQVGVRAHGIGWLRYFLMTRLLSTTSTVAEAVDLIRSVRHAGGGTLVLADRLGTVAAVELDADGVAIETAPVVCRTNHFTTTSLAPETLVDPRSGIEDTSRARRAFLDEVLPGRSWDAAQAAQLMAQHRTAEERSAPLCQHQDAGGTRTISTAVYCCRSSLMYACLDNPCTGPWQSIALMS